MVRRPREAEPDTITHGAAEDQRDEQQGSPQIEGRHRRRSFRRGWTIDRRLLDPRRAQPPSVPASVPVPPVPLVVVVDPPVPLVVEPPVPVGEDVLGVELVVVDPPEPGVEVLLHAARTASADAERRTRARGPAGTANRFEIMKAPRQLPCGQLWNGRWMSASLYRRNLPSPDRKAPPAGTVSGWTALSCVVGVPVENPSSKVREAG
jgi:hypothetical protein